MERTAENINILGKFCGKRDIEELTSKQLQEHYGIEQADVMVLFGGTILCGGDVLANAMQNRIAKKYIIVGGAGHTTETLRLMMNIECPEIETENLTEAELFSNYISCKYGLQPDFLECNSTNCGNNITYLLDLLREKKITYQSIIISQDATMQHRMEAVLRKYQPEITIINYATYKATVVAENEKLTFKEDILGMWNIERYISLLMGEIPRLSDDEKGYGPNGKGFIAHVEIPEKVSKAFQELKSCYANLVREANPLFASKEDR